MNFMPLHNAITSRNWEMVAHIINTTPCPNMPDYHALIKAIGADMPIPLFNHMIYKGYAGPNQKAVGATMLYIAINNKSPYVAAMFDGRWFHRTEIIANLNDVDFRDFLNRQTAMEIDKILKERAVLASL